MLKKRGKRKMSMPKVIREKNTCQKHEEKKREKKRKNSTYIQIKGIHPKERDS
jgi:hypothetical protein